VAVGVEVGVAAGVTEGVAVGPAGANHTGSLASTPGVEPNAP
jgi:hypothetical protein